MNTSKGWQLRMKIWRKRSIVFRSLSAKSRILNKYVNSSPPRGKLSFQPSSLPFLIKFPKLLRFAGVNFIVFFGYIGCSISKSELTETLSISNESDCLLKQTIARSCNQFISGSMCIFNSIRVGGPSTLFISPPNCDDSFFLRSLT